MTKKRKIYLIIISAIGLFILCGNIDYYRIKNNKNPIMSIYIGKDKEMNIKKWLGFGYRVYTCPAGSDNSEAEYNEDNKTKIAILFSPYICVTSFDVEIATINYEITDESDTCEPGLEEIGKDNKYIYYLECQKSEQIFINYEDGERITLKKALGRMDIHNLIENGLEVYQKRIDN